MERNDEWQTQSRYAQMASQTARAAIGQVPL
jgi:hypothetical protein